MTEEVLNSRRIAQFAVEEAKKGNPILLDVSNMEITNLSYIRKIINLYLYNGTLFDESTKEYVKIFFEGKFHPQIPHKLIKVYTCLKYKDGTYRRAINEGYTILGINSKGYPQITVLKHLVPYLSHDDVISYFN